jgi:hypothetical protein
MRFKNLNGRLINEKGRWQTGFRGFWAEGDKRKAERAPFSDEQDLRSYFGELK